MSNSQKKIYEYQPSQQVTQAKPGDYSSKWQTKSEDMLDQIAGREEFSYDVNADALYDQYKDQYIRQGKLAMEDTLGQAAALTGGFGSSYGQTVGGQVYQGYMQQLADKVPELSRLAYDRYQQEGQDMKDLYALYRDMEAQDYGRYRDSVSDYLTERDFDYGQHRDQVADSQYKEQFDYQKGRDEVADSQWQKQYEESVRQYNEQFAYGKERDQVADSQWQQQYDQSLREYEESVRQYNEQFAYQQGRDQVADDQWQKQYEESVRQYNESMAFSKQQYEESKASGDQSAALEHVSSMSSEELVDTMQGYSSDGDMLGLEAFLDDCVASGRLTMSQAVEYLGKFETGGTNAQDTTVPPATAPTTTAPITPGSANRPTVSPSVVGGTERERQEAQANRLRDRVNIKI